MVPSWTGRGAARTVRRRRPLPVPKLHRQRPVQSPPGVRRGTGGRLPAERHVRLSETANDDHDDDDLDYHDDDHRTPVLRHLRLRRGPGLLQRSVQAEPLCGPERVLDTLHARLHAVSDRRRLPLQPDVPDLLR